MAVLTKEQRKYRILKGKSEWNLLSLLKRQAGGMTLEEIAPLVPARGGKFGIEVQSARTKISALKTKLLHESNKPANVPADKWEKYVNAKIMPKNFGEHVGRPAGELASADDLADLVDVADFDFDTLDENE